MLKMNGFGRCCRELATHAKITEVIGSSHQLGFFDTSGVGAVYQLDCDTRERLAMAVLSHHLRDIDASYGWAFPPEPLPSSVPLIDADGRLAMELAVGRRIELVHVDCTERRWSFIGFLDSSDVWTGYRVDRDTMAEMASTLLDQLF